MKDLFIVIALLSGVIIYAQEETVKNTLFVRVYNLEGEKMNKGKVLVVNDTILQLLEKNKTVNIDVRTIGLIKTKRSEGNNLLTGALLGLTAGAIIGVATADPDAWFGYSAAEGATGIGLVGALVGTGVGAVTIPFKNSKSYIINGDASKWKVFEEMIRNNK